MDTGSRYSFHNSYYANAAQWRWAARQLWHSSLSKFDSVFYKGSNAAFVQL